MATVLVLDKDPLQLELMAMLLRKERHRAVTTSDPENALALMQSEVFQLVIVETVLPGHDGYRLCREMLEARPEVALMIISERGEESEIVRALLAGADDYVTKPFSPREMLARVQVVLRRTSGEWHSVRKPAQLALGEVVLNVAQVQVIVNGHQVPLTAREFALLHALMSEANRVLSREQLMRLVWGDTFVSPKAVDVCVQRVRNKMRPHLLKGDYVEAARGQGYRFANVTPSFTSARLPGSSSPTSRVARAIAR